MKENLDKDNKVSILLSALEERHTSLHAIRERAENIGIWSLGILLGAGGWLLQSQDALTNLQKLTMVLGATIAFWTLRFIYLKDLQIGFKNQQCIIVRLEKALGFFTPHIFDDLDEPIYPMSWQKAGTEDGDGKFFHSVYILLYVGIAFLVISIIFHGCLQ